MMPFFVAIVFSPRPTIATPVHTHCDVMAWTEEFTTNNSRSYDIPQGGLDYRLGGNATGLTDFLFDIAPRTTPPSSGNINCLYEISDITKINIKFEFTGTMKWESLKVSGGGTGTLLDATYETTPPFSSGFATSFTFQPHLMEDATRVGPLELSLPNQAFVRLINDNNDFVITKAEITMSGSHYYVPEPSTALLLLAGFSMLLRRQMK